MLYYFCVLIYKYFLKGGYYIKKFYSVQEWLPFDKITDDGIIINQNKYIKIIKVIPINYDLKSNLEKESILNSYKLFLKVCDFDIQILVQSKKEDLSSYISKMNNQNFIEKNNSIKKISQSFIDYIKNQNKVKNSSSKNFYILINYLLENPKNDLNNLKFIKENLKEKFFKIKDSLSRCGNVIFEVDTKREVEQIMYSFCNLRKSLKFL